MDRETAILAEGVECTTFPNSVTDKITDYIIGQDKVSPNDLQAIAKEIFGAHERITGVEHKAKLALELKKRFLPELSRNIGIFIESAKSAERGSQASSEVIMPIVFPDIDQKRGRSVWRLVWQGEHKKAELKMFDEPADTSSAQREYVEEGRDQ